MAAPRAVELMGGSRTKSSTASIARMIKLFKQRATRFQDRRIFGEERLNRPGKAKNAWSILFRAATRTAKAMGYRGIITYILKTEPGTSLKAAGWTCDGDTEGGSWDVPSRGTRGQAPDWAEGPMEEKPLRPC